MILLACILQDEVIPQWIGDIDITSYKTDSFYVLIRIKQMENEDFIIYQDIVSTSANYCQKYQAQFYSGSNQIQVPHKISVYSSNICELEFKPSSGFTGKVNIQYSFNNLYMDNKDTTFNINYKYQTNVVAIFIVLLTIIILIVFYCGYQFSRLNDEKQSIKFSFIIEYANQQKIDKLYLLELQNDEKKHIEEEMFKNDPIKKYQLNKKIYTNKIVSLCNQLRKNDNQQHKIKQLYYIYTDIKSLQLWYVLQQLERDDIVKSYMVFRQESQLNDILSQISNDSKSFMNDASFDEQQIISTQKNSLNKQSVDLKHHLLDLSKAINNKAMEQILINYFQNDNQQYYLHKDIIEGQEFVFCKKFYLIIEKVENTSLILWKQPTNHELSKTLSHISEDNDFNVNDQSVPSTSTQPNSSVNKSDNLEFIDMETFFNDVIKSQQLQNQNLSEQQMEQVKEINQQYYNLININQENTKQVIKNLQLEITIADAQATYKFRQHDQIREIYMSMMKKQEQILDDEEGSENMILQQLHKELLNQKLINYQDSFQVNNDSIESPANLNINQNIQNVNLNQLLIIAQPQYEAIFTPKVLEQTNSFDSASNPVSPDARDEVERSALLPILQQIMRDSKLPPTINQQLLPVQQQEDKIALFDNTQQQFDNAPEQNIFQQTATKVHNADNQDHNLLISQTQENYNLSTMKQLQSDLATLLSIPLQSSNGISHRISKNISFSDNNRLAPSRASVSDGTNTENYKLPLFQSFDDSAISIENQQFNLMDQLPTLNDETNTKQLENQELVLPVFEEDSNNDLQNNSENQQQEQNLNTLNIQNDNKQLQLQLPVFIDGSSASVKKSSTDNQQLLFDDDVSSSDSQKQQHIKQILSQASEDQLEIISQLALPTFDNNQSSNQPAQQSPKISLQINNSQNKNDTLSNLQLPTLDQPLEQISQNNFLLPQFDQQNNDSAYEQLKLELPTFDEDQNNNNQQNQIQDNQQNNELVLPTFDINDQMQQNQLPTFNTDVKSVQNSEPINKNDILQDTELNIQQPLDLQLPVFDFPIQTQQNEILQQNINQLPEFQNNQLDLQLPTFDQNESPNKQQNVDLPVFENNGLNPNLLPHQNTTQTPNNNLSQVQIQLPRFDSLDQPNLQQFQMQLMQMQNSQINMNNNQNQYSTSELPLPDLLGNQSNQIDLQLPIFNTRSPLKFKKPNLKETMQNNKKILNLVPQTSNQLVLPLLQDMPANSKDMFKDINVLKSGVCSGEQSDAEQNEGVLQLPDFLDQFNLDQNENIIVLNGQQINLPQTDNEKQFIQIGAHSGIISQLDSFNESSMDFKNNLTTTTQSQQAQSEETNDPNMAANLIKLLQNQNQTQSSDRGSNKKLQRQIVKLKNNKQDDKQSKSQQHDTGQKQQAESKKLPVEPAKKEFKVLSAVGDLDMLNQFKQQNQQNDVMSQNSEIQLAKQKKAKKAYDDTRSNCRSEVRSQVSIANNKRNIFYQKKKEEHVIEKINKQKNSSFVIDLYEDVDEVKRINVMVDQLQKYRQQLQGQAFVSLEKQQIQQQLVFKIQLFHQNELKNKKFQFIDYFSLFDKQYRFKLAVIIIFKLLNSDEQTLFFNKSFDILIEQLIFKNKQSSISKMGMIQLEGNLCQMESSPSIQYDNTNYKIQIQEKFTSFQTEFNINHKVERAEIFQQERLQVFCACLFVAELVFLQKFSKDKFIQFALNSQNKYAEFILQMMVFDKIGVCIREMAQIV